MKDQRVLKIDIDYKLPPKKEGETDRTEGAQLTENYLESAVTSAHPQGLEGQQRRIWGRIQRKIDEAIEKETGEIVLEREEWSFLRKAFESCKAPAAIAKYFVILEDMIEEAEKKQSTEPQS